LAALFVLLSVASRASAQGVIYVTSLDDKISGTGGCSLQEAIYSSSFQSNTALMPIENISEYTPQNLIATQCVAGTGNDTIILPVGGVFQLTQIIDDLPNAFGPTATPLITSNITIEANGSVLEWVPPYASTARAFSVSNTGSLTIKNAHIKGFSTRGGDGTFGGGGGMGAGGAIYVFGGSLTVENCTFDGNGAVGGNGGGKGFGDTGGGGGGGGLSGFGGQSGYLQNFGIYTAQGGGGGGSRGSGSSGDLFNIGNGGGGGGTALGATFAVGGINCGGNGGSGDIGDVLGTGTNGQNAPCAGGGGGGAGEGQLNLTTNPNNGGSGNYGGGGGGGSSGGGDGGNGGLGGGGGAAWSGILTGANGGQGGFGGGGGSASGGSLAGTGDPGLGGKYGGNANSFNGGGGAALGGVIFNDSGSVLVENSTFANNSVLRGLGGNAGQPGAADNGADAGGAIFTVNGQLTVIDSTISGNQGSGSDSGITVVQTAADNPTSLTLDDTIIVNNGALDANGNPTGTSDECSVVGPSVTIAGAGNLIQNNDNCDGVVSTVDPKLGALQFNSDPAGPTPTMAINSKSSAFNAADPSTSLSTDQRGAPRPSLGGYDIGAFELCVAQIFDTCVQVVGQKPATEPLIMIASPPAGGTLTPGSGNPDTDSVVVVAATPNPGYTFADWSSNVASPSESTSTILMNQPQTVTATFTPLPTSILGNIASESGAANDRDWSLTLLNNGPGGAYGATITTFTLTQTGGAACTPTIIHPTFPALVGDLAPAQTGTLNIFLNFTGCAATSRFTATFAFSANGGTVTGSVVRANQFE
jgi:hypothetical protein